MKNRILLLLLLVVYTYPQAVFAQEKSLSAMAIRNVSVTFCDDYITVADLASKIRKVIKKKDVVSDLKITSSKSALINDIFIDVPFSGKTTNLNFAIVEHSKKHIYRLDQKMDDIVFISIIDEHITFILTSNSTVVVIEKDIFDAYDLLESGEMTFFYPPINEDKDFAEWSSYVSEFLYQATNKCFCDKELSGPKPTKN